MLGWEPDREQQRGRRWRDPEDREKELVADSGLCDRLINTTGALAEQIAFSVHCD